MGPRVGSLGVWAQGKEKVEERGESGGGHGRHARGDDRREEAEGVCLL